MRIFKLIAPLLLFIIGGVYGLFSQSIIQAHFRPLYVLLIPSFALGVYYSFKLTSKHAKSKNGSIAFLRIFITILITMISFRATEGYAILYNCNIGKQQDTILRGEVTQLDFPNPKQLFDKNSINIAVENSNEILSLEVPDKNYNVGQLFERKMKLGSLGILYSSN